MTAKSAQFDNEEVAQQGYLKRLKTGKKRYFVLRRPTKSGKGRLEYYGSRKKFIGNADPKKYIYMKDCLHVCTIEDKKYSNVFALFTKLEKFGLIADNQEALDRWLSAIKQVRKECLELEDSLKYDEVWSIRVKDEGLGRSKNIGGVYHLGLQEDILALLKPDLHEVLHVIHLNNIKRSGQKDRFFFMEIGRKDTLGPGEIWIEVDEACIAEHMKRTIFGLGNRPRSQTDGSSKEKLNQDPAAFNRSISQCENNRNKIGSNYGTLKLPAGPNHNETGQLSDDKGGWINQTLLNTSPSGSTRRPATVDFDSIAVNFTSMQVDFPKRLTVSTADLLDNSVATSADSDEYAASDDDTSGDINIDSSCEEPYVAMHYSSPPEHPSFMSKVDHYDYVSPAKHAQNVENREVPDNEGVEDVYVAMAGEDDIAAVRDRETLLPPKQRAPVYHNVENLKESLSSVESRGSLKDIKESTIERETTPGEASVDGIYTNVRNTHLDVVAEIPAPVTTGSKFSEFRNKVGNLPKALTLSPRLRRHTRGKHDVTRQAAPSSCFYVDSPTDNINGQQPVSKSKKRSLPVNALIDDSPSYVNIPRGDRGNVQVEEWRIKSESSKNSDGKFAEHGGEKGVKEQVQIKDKPRNQMVYSNVDSTMPYGSPPDILTAREKRLVKQVSLPERQVVTPELPRKGSMPPVRDYVNIPVGNGVRQNSSHSRGGLDRGKTRQGKTVQAGNRQQVYTDFVLPGKLGKKPSKQVGDETDSSSVKTNGYQNINDPYDQNHRQAFYSSSVGKSVSYENLLDNQSEFEKDRRRVAHELAYADLALTHGSPDYAREFVSQRSYIDSTARRRKYKMSRSCDDIFSSVDSDVYIPSEEVYSMSPKGGKGITYMEVDIERSLGLAEAVREQRLQNENVIQI